MTVKQLFELQELDLDIEAKREALLHLESQLGESESLVEARSALEEERKRLARLESEQKAAEWGVDDLQAKIKALEQKLYGGSVRNPRELRSLQEEVEHLKARCKAQEDKVLDIMTQVEAAQSELGVRSEELEQMQEDWQATQARLAREQEELGVELAALDQKRRQLLSRIEPDSLDFYEGLRGSKQGRAIAKAERGMCQGCRVTLSMAELQQARMGRRLVQCSNCGRILYVS